MSKEMMIFGKMLEISDERMIDLMVHREIKRIAQETSNNVKNYFDKHKTIDEFMSQKDAFTLLFALVYSQCELFLEENGILQIDGSEIQKLRHRNPDNYFGDVLEKLEDEYRRILIFEDSNKDSKLRKLYKDSSMRQEMQDAAYMDVYDLIPIIQYLLKKKGIANDPITLDDEKEAVTLFQYLKNNNLDKEKAYKIAYQLFSTDPTELEYFDWCIVHYPEEMENLVRLERIVGYNPSKQVLESGLKALFEKMPHNTEDQVLVIKKRLEEIKTSLKITESDTINKVDKLLYQFDLDARTFLYIEFATRDLKKKAEEDYQELMQYCKNINEISEKECEEYRNYILSRSYVPEIVNVFIKQIDERKTTIWMMEDAEKLDKIFLNTDINNPESVSNSILEIEKIGRTDDKDKYVNALNGMNPENRELFNKYCEWKEKKFLNKYLVQIILFVTGILGMMFGIGIFILIAAIVVTVVKARQNKKMKEAWEMLSMNGKLLHPQLQANNIVEISEVSCSACGKQVNATAEFCKYCGTKISK